MALPKDMRLKGHRTFDYIHKNSIKYHGKLMSIKVATSNPEILSKHKLTNNSNNLKIHKFFKILLTLGKIYYCNFLLENLNILKSWEQIKGAKKPVKKTSAKIFLRLGINIKELLSEKFLNKICKK